MSNFVFVNVKQRLFLLKNREIWLCHPHISVLKMLLELFYLEYLTDKFVISKWEKKFKMLFEWRLGQIIQLIINFIPSVNSECKWTICIIIWIKYYKLINNCCIFWPANGCFTNSWVVEISFFIFLTFFTITNVW